MVKINIKGLELASKLENQFLTQLSVQDAQNKRESRMETSFLPGGESPAVPEP